MFSIVLSGCHGALPAPEQTLRTYANHLETGEVDSAYKLLSKPMRASVPRAAFQRLMTETPRETTEIAASLRLPVVSTTIASTLTTPQGDEIKMVFEEGHWRILRSSFDLYGQSTPKQTARSFVRALEKKRYDILLRFVPDARRVSDSSRAPLDARELAASWEGAQKAALQRVVDGIKSNEAMATVEELGDHAVVTYGPQAALRMVLEQGKWKVESFPLTINQAVA